VPPLHPKTGTISQTLSGFFSAHFQAQRSDSTRLPQLHRWNCIACSAGSSDVEPFMAHNRIACSASSSHLMHLSMYPLFPRPYPLFPGPYAQPQEVRINHLKGILHALQKQETDPAVSDFATLRLSFLPALLSKLDAANVPRDTRRPGEREAKEGRACPCYSEWCYGDSKTSC
jgi:hypothetical protein